MVYGLIQIYVDQTTERVAYHHGIWADTDVRHMVNITPQDVREKTINPCQDETVEVSN